MIKFFRHIRRSLINENKMGKPTSAKATVGRYFKYAIGEIILVMIGILLALQVNNWNEKRKLKAQQQTFLKSITQDLKADVVYLQDLLVKLDTNYQTLKDQSKKVNRISHSRDSLIHFLKKEINVFITTFDGFNNNTYESMKTSGKLDLLDETIKQPLFELSILHHISYNNIEGLKDDYFDEIENLVRYYPIQVPFSFIKDTSQNNFIWENTDKKDLMLKLNIWGTVKANLLRNSINEFSTILEKTETLLELIENTND